MKKTIKALLCVAMMLAVVVPFTVFAGDKAESKTVKAPTLQSIEFNDAEIEGDFSPTQFYYNINVNSDGETPTLKKYKVSKGAEIFVTYNQDGVNGINVEVKNVTLSANYFFEYKYNDVNVNLNSNTNLKELDCELGCVYPAINNEETYYQLYIPKDMTELKLTAVPEDLGASCNVPKEFKMTTEQNPIIEASVVSSDGTLKSYKFEVKRLDLTSKELKKELKNNSYEDIIKNEVFHKSPQFRVMLLGIFGGIVILAIAVLILKRVAVKAQDDDETEFFDYLDEPENEDEE
ncbi:hypothetical protein [Eubacterium coprostanoligenes]|uniref:hypothetical protein n=1 Tax=Eubacterium coprostanoligenes TaxID=290054 RepID=UPI0023552223|nr:hypothetical protein [Eubacterium coprostanoligenes]MCI6354445.1 hypothetical protein [Eubacterium coprostanoligenes]MDD7358068.1 hypothetical protein [Eubacterium coprostanoligenes]